MNIVRRFRRWLINKYLHAYVSESQKEDMRALQVENTALRYALEKERAYSAGLEYACRRKVAIQIEK